MKLGKNNILIVVVVGIIVLFLLMRPPTEIKEMKKEVGPHSAVLTRTVTPTSVTSGGNFTLKYTISGSTGNYGGILYETVPTGFTIGTTSFLSSMDVFSKKITGQLVEMPFAGSATGQYIQFIITAGTASGTLTNGKIEWGSGAGNETLSSTALTVCVPQASSACYSGNRYWYDSCGVLGAIRETCTQTACGSFGSDVCSGLTIQHSRTCYTKGCSADVCTNTPYTDTQTNTAALHSTSGICGWQCSSGLCLQNSGADVNYNGLVTNQELLDYITLWISGSVINTQLLAGITAWIGA